jgi:hypothetical protein
LTLISKFFFVIVNVADGQLRLGSNISINLLIASVLLKMIKNALLFFNAFMIK